MRKIVKLFIVFFAFTIGSLLCAKPYEESQQDLLGKIDQILQNRAFALNSNFDGYRFVSNIACSRDDDSKVFEDAVNEALQSFGVSHLYLTTHEGILDSLLATRQSNMSWDITSDGLVIKAVDSDNKVNIQPGDLILKQSIHADRYIIDGQNDLIWSIDLKRNGQVIKNIPIRFQNSLSMGYLLPHLSWISSGVALLQIPSFGDDYPVKLVEDLVKKASKAKLVVLDFQNNSGGSEQNLLHFANLTLPSHFFIGATIDKQDDAVLTDQSGTWETLVSKVPHKERLMTSNGSNLGYGPHLLVLVNSQTASSAEIIAQALKEAYGPTKCKIAGVCSAGEVLEGRLTPLDDEFCLYYPAADYLTGKGYRIQNNGVIPDISLSMKPGLTEEKKKQLLAVIQDLKPWCEKVEPNKRVVVDPDQ